MLGQTLRFTWLSGPFPVGNGALQMGVTSFLLSQVDNTTAKLVPCMNHMLQLLSLFFVSQGRDIQTQV